MVKLASCTVFAAFLLIGGLFFYVSKNALDMHLVSVESGSLLGSHDSRDKSWHLNPANQRPLNNPQIQKTLTDSETSAPAAAVAQSEICHVSFPCKCELSHNLIKYWEEECEDCFQSPLRNSSGLLAKNFEDRRFLVFQPDLGGWNNVRMGNTLHHNLSTIRCKRLSTFIFDRTNLTIFLSIIALEVAILFAHITGRILVLPPNYVLYLLAMNKAVRNNKSSMEDYLDFDRMRAGFGLETITMKEFLSTVAVPGFLSQPLPENNSDLTKDPLWTYLESACYTRKWSTGKTFLGFNITKAEERISSLSGGENKSYSGRFGTFEGVDKERLDLITLNSKRKMVHYDKEFHANRAVYLSGYAANRILTHWYGYFFFAEPKVERSAKRFMRDRVRYHDVIFCAAGRVVDLILSEVTILRKIPRADDEKNILTMDEIQRKIGDVDAMPLVSYSHSNSNTHAGRGGGGAGGGTDSGDDDEIDSRRVYRLLALNNSYIAYHIRRGDFQQKQTRLEAADILNITLKLLPNNPEDWVVYIATDERDRTFFREFQRTFRSVRFLDDYQNHANLRDMNQNHLGMLEQVVCANAHTFIGTPLSTFTSYITRMRGYMAKSTLVETNPPLPSALLTDIHRYNLKFNSKVKPTPSDPPVMVPLLHKQIGVPIQEINQQNEKLVGKIFTRRNDKVRNDVKPYKENDEKTFTTDLLLHPRTLYKRSSATIQESPGTILSFLTENYLTEMKSKDKEVISSTPLAVGIYDRTYYFIDRFTQQLHAHPRLILPFWVREFSDAFLDSEEEIEYVPA